MTDTPQHPATPPVIIDPEHPEAGRGGVVPPVHSRFQPGNRANPGGRPHGASLIAPLLRKLAANPNEHGEGKLAEEAAQRAADAMISGDKDVVKSFLDMADRTDGPIIKERAITFTQITEGIVLNKRDGPPPPLPIEEVT